MEIPRPPNATNDPDIMHELVHAHNDMTIIPPLAIINDEGQGYMAANNMYAALRYLRLMEVDGINSSSCEASIVKTYWRMFWSIADYRTATGTYTDPLPPYTPISFPLVGADVRLVKNSLGFCFECQKLVDRYNRDIQTKGCCYKLVCQPTSNINEIGPSMTLPREYLP